MNSNQWYDLDDLVRRRAEIISDQQEKLRRAIEDLKDIMPNLTFEQQVRAAKILRMMIDALDIDDELSELDRQS